MDELWAELAGISDSFLEEAESVVPLLADKILRELNPESDEDLVNLGFWLALLLELIEENLIKRVPLDQRAEALTQQFGQQVVDTSPLIAQMRSNVGVMAAHVTTKTSEAIMNQKRGEELIQAIEKAIESGLADFVRSLDTSMSMYDRLFMEEVGRGGTGVWRYAGPSDARNRPFCGAIVRNKILYTDSGIEKLNNHPLLHSYVPPNVKMLCGGYNCRHVWVPVTRAQISALGWTVES